jgi:hypothetical protein
MKQVMRNFEARRQLPMLDDGPLPDSGLSPWRCHADSFQDS